MPPESFLTVGEFTRAQQTQTTLLLNEFGHIRETLEDYHKRLSTVETQVSERTNAASAESRKHAVKWGSVVAGGIVTISKIGEHWTDIWATLHKLL